MTLLELLHILLLIILDLSWSPVTEDSQVWRQIMEKVDELKSLELARMCSVTCIVELSSSNQFGDFDTGRLHSVISNWAIH